jgi:hypothetical protein
MEPWFHFLQMWEDIGRNAARDIHKRYQAVLDAFPYKLRKA